MGLGTAAAGDGESGARGERQGGSLAVVGKEVTSGGELAENATAEEAGKVCANSSFCVTPSTATSLLPRLCLLGLRLPIVWRLLSWLCSEPWYL